MIEPAWALRLLLLRVFSSGDTLLSKQPCESRHFCDLLELVQDALEAVLLVFRAAAAGASTKHGLRSALTCQLLAQLVVLLDNETGKVEQWLVHGFAPAADHTQLPLAKVNKVHLDLGLAQISQHGAATLAIVAHDRAHLVELYELEPVLHDFLVELTARLDNLEHHVAIGALSTGERGTLTLQDILLLLFELRNQIWRQLKHQSHEVAGHRLV